MRRLIFGLLLLAAPVLVPVPVVEANNHDQVCPELPPGQQEECRQAADGNPMADLTETVLNLLSWIVGILSVVMFIVGGFMYVLSAGNPENTKRAKDTLLYAVVGVVVVFAAQAVVQFVLSSL